MYIYIYIYLCISCIYIFIYSYIWYINICIYVIYNMIYISYTMKEPGKSSTKSRHGLAADPRAPSGSVDARAAPFAMGEINGEITGIFPTTRGDPVNVLAFSWFISAKTSHNYVFLMHHKPMWNCSYVHQLNAKTVMGAPRVVGNIMGKSWGNGHLSSSFSCRCLREDSGAVTMFTRQMVNGNSRILKWRYGNVPYFFGRILRGYSLKFRPCI